MTQDQNSAPRSAAGAPESGADAPGLLEALTPGMPIVYGGNRVAHVTPELAAAFVAGDQLLVTSAGTLLHVPAADQLAARSAVDDAVAAFAQLGSVTDEAISAFFTGFAARLADPSTFEAIAQANQADVADARARGRSTTRLVLTEAMRADMIDGLLGWAKTPSGRGDVAERIEHPGWTVEQVRDALGVVAFVFEGRPNVFADACGVLRGGNAVVFRIGSDALGTARAIVEHALRPALAEAGLPLGAARLVDAPSRAAGWALFSDARLSLAVARGSGLAVEQLGSVARSAGVPVSLHGTGGGWMIAGPGADAARFAAVAENSLDRKVCNTLNVCVITKDRAAELVPAFLSAVLAAGVRRGTNPKLHVLEGAQEYVPGEWFERQVPIGRAAGPVVEAQAELMAAPEDLGTEWEWEDSPEVTLAVAEDLDQAMQWCSGFGPRLVATLISEDPGEQARFFAGVDVPFVGDGFTRWVDGQFAFSRPELGLSNWENGRLFGRGSVLSGDSVFTLRTRVRQSDPGLRR